MHQNHLEVWLVITQIAESHPRISDSVNQGWGLIIYIANKFPGDAAH